MMIELVQFWPLLNIDNSSTRIDPAYSQESEEWVGYSVAIHVLLPLAGFCILWGRRDLLTRLLLQIDRSCIAVCCPSFSKREKLLKWAGENLPCTWSSPSRTLSGGIPDLWKDGSLLCTLINMAIPGACSNPPKHWKKSPSHAQALAYKYLGIVPVFTEDDFSGSFSHTQERKFLFYLQELQQAIKKQSSESIPTTFSSDYLTKGMGLQTGTQYRKTTFYVYSNTTNSNCKNIFVYIRGPYGTQGTATIPAFYNLNSIPVLNYLHKQFRASNKIMYKTEARKSFLKSIALDFTSFVNLEKKVLTNDIPILVEMEHDRAKITYIPNNYGIYEINLITNGECLNGSPFAVSVTENSGLQDSFESTEKILKDLPAVKKKKIISRFIDCIDKKIQLKVNRENICENPLEKIASVSVVTDEADALKSVISVENLAEALPHAVIQYESHSEIPKEMSQFEIGRKMEKIYEVSNQDEKESNKIQSNPETVHVQVKKDCCSAENTKTSTSNINGQLRNPTITVSFETSNETILNSKTEEDDLESNILENNQSSRKNAENIFNSSVSDLAKNENFVKLKANCTAVNVGSNSKFTMSSFNQLKINPNFDEAQFEPLFSSLYTKNDEPVDYRRESLNEIILNDLNSNKVNHSKETYENMDEKCLSSEVIHRNKKWKNKNIDTTSSRESTLIAKNFEIPNQNRPTSIVSPFLKIENNKSGEKENINHFNQQFNNEDGCVTRDETFSEEIFPVNSRKNLLTISNEKNVKDIYCTEKTFENCHLTEPEKTYIYKTSESNVDKAVSEKYVDSLEYNISETMESDYLLLENRKNKNSIQNIYVENIKTVLLNKMTFQSENSKIMKDFVNTTNKLKSLNTHQLNQDENNNKFPNKPHNSTITSPICPTHIVPEVVPEESLSFGNLSLSDKRKVFSRQARLSLPSSNDTSISEKENEDGLRQLAGQKYSLRVLSVIDTLKNSTISHSLSRSTSSSVSDIPKSTHLVDSTVNTSDELDNSRSTFLKTREFWKRMSLENCSSISSTSTSRHQEFGSKTESRAIKDSFLYCPDIHRSADDILSLSRSNFKSKIMQKYGSLDQKEMEAINFMSIEERKKQLFQDGYERENLGSRFIKKHMFTNNKHAEVTVDGEETKAVSSKSSINQEPPKLIVVPEKEVKEVQIEKKISKPLTQFKRAITFFKNLEKSSSSRKEPFKEKRIKSSETRRLSLDFGKTKKGKPKVGGSLRLPKTLEKFSVSQIYFDIMENGRGSFKGRPNRKALSETLASFSTKHDSTVEEDDCENHIKYNMFLHKLKAKKRKSIRSIFNIHY